MRLVFRRFLVLFATLAAASAMPAQPPAVAAPRQATPSLPATVDGQPDLQGVWDFRTATRLQRPYELADQAFFTDAEAAEYERQQIAKRFARTDIGHPNCLLDPGDRVSPSMRTSLIADPADGRLPPLVPDARRKADAAPTTTTRWWRPWVA